MSDLLRVVERSRDDVMEVENYMAREQPGRRAVRPDARRTRRRRLSTCASPRRRVSGSRRSARGRPARTCVRSAARRELGQRDLAVALEDRARRALGPRRARQGGRACPARAGSRGRARAARASVGGGRRRAAARAGGRRRCSSASAASVSGASRALAAAVAAAPVRARARRARAGRRAGRARGRGAAGWDRARRRRRACPAGASERITSRSPRRRHDRLLEPQLKEAPAELDEPRRRLARAVMDADPRAVVGPRVRGGPRERNVDAIGRRPGRRPRPRRRRGPPARRRRRRRPARPRRARRPRGSARRAGRPRRARPLCRAPRTPRTRAARPAGSIVTCVAARGGARPQRAGHDRAGAADAEDAVDVQAQRAASARLRRDAARGRAPPQRVECGAGARRRRRSPPREAAPPPRRALARGRRDRSS